MAIERLSALAKENEDLKEALQKKQYQLDKKEKELASKEAVLSTREEKLLEKAKEDKEKMLREAEEKIDELISSLNSPEVKLHQAIAAKKKLEELEEKQKIEEFDGEVAVGDYVKVPAFGIVGKVERIQGNKVYLSTRDGKSLQTSKQSVTKASAPQEERVAMKGAVADRLGFDGVGLELNIIGYHVDEALEAVASYLDKCRLRGLHRVRIIHGYGSGALRQAVHSYLKAHASFVKKYSLGGEYEGGSGATVVELK
jgi:DNA mismatch repair protein MutS2